MHIALKDLLKQLPRDATPQWPEGVWDTEAFQRGPLTLELFAPQGEDHQTPHARDELYIVVRGRGDFVLEGERVHFGPGDVLFARAGTPHHFTRLTEPLVAWVVFFGPPGGCATE
jgi:mannose-6-phosphate isomerase-like protein (cupin superfamily)